MTADPPARATRVTHGLDAIRAALATLPAEDCAQAERIGAALKSDLGDAGIELWLEWNRKAGFDDEQSLRDMWQKFEEGGTLELLFNKSRRFGSERQVGAEAGHLTPLDRQLPAPPYPASIKARGWSFDLDYQRIEASDTWALAGPELRPWLLMLWLVAWRSIPCGSLPRDASVIAAHIGMAPDRFAACRDTLLRGWRAHADGRLYHCVVTEKVLDMIATRRSETDRKAARKARQAAEAAGVPADSHGNPTRVPPISDTDPDPDPDKPSSSPVGEEVSSASPATPARPVPDCPHEQIIAIYHELLPTNPHVREWNEARRSSLRARWREKAKPNGVTQGYTTVEDGLAWWREYFAYVAGSPFLTGRTSGRDGRPPFVADLEWLVKPTNFARVIEGKYHG